MPRSGFSAFSWSEFQLKIKNFVLIGYLEKDHSIIETHLKSVIFSQIVGISFCNSFQLCFFSGH